MDNGIDRRFISAGDLSYGRVSKYGSTYFLLSLDSKIISNRATTIKMVFFLSSTLSII